MKMANTRGNMMRDVTSILLALSMGSFFFAAGNDIDDDDSLAAVVDVFPSRDVTSVTEEVGRKPDKLPPPLLPSGF